MKDRRSEPPPSAVPAGKRPRPQRFPGRRRLLVASIGAVTVHYAAACAGGDRWGTVVANLMAAPGMPSPGGAGGGGGSGAGAQSGAGARSGSGGAGGAGGASAGAGADMDAGADDDGGSP